MRETKIEKRLKSNEKGITLIALVITIIVLIILAGVAISMLSGDNGILKQAATAKEETEKQSEIEKVRLAVTAAMMNKDHKINKEDLDAELAKYGFPASSENGENEYKIAGKNNTYIITDNGEVRGETEIEKLIASQEEVTGQKLTTTDANGDKITIPVGFKIADDSATLVKDGIVVVAPEPDNSEFVWIPVEDVTDMYEEKEIDGETRKVGKLYTFTADGHSQRTYSSSSYREPDILKDTKSGDASTTADRGLNLLKSIVGIEGTVGTDNDAMLATWKTQLQKEFNEMIDSVSKNGGFYVGRYETSLSSSGNAQSIQGATSATAANANTWYGLYQREKEYSEKNSLSSVVGSSMIWGSQYDQMLIWMQKNDINVASSTPIPNASRNQDRTTGTHDADKLNNIYDILGNSREWTLEANNTLVRVDRRRQLQQQQFAS